MKTDHPSLCHRNQMRKLWQDAFGDTDAFLDLFYITAYAPDRCLGIFIAEELAAALYWIDCHIQDQKLAYIYAVVTAPAHRGKGLCRKLMADTHELLKSRGYSGSILVPQKESLRQMYVGMGYQDAGGLTVFSCEAGTDPIPLRAVGPQEFAALRRSLLPENAVIQEGEGLDFLAQQLQFYAGDDVLLAAYAENGTLHGIELLGNRNAAPGILKALDIPQGIFRTPGHNQPFAMFHPLANDAICPKYFGFAFD